MGKASQCLFAFIWEGKKSSLFLPNFKKLISIQAPLQENHILSKLLTIKGTQSPRKNYSLLKLSPVFGEPDLRNELHLDHGILNFPGSKIKKKQQQQQNWPYYRHTSEILWVWLLNLGLIFTKYLYLRIKYTQFILLKKTFSLREFLTDMRQLSLFNKKVKFSNDSKLTRYGTRRNTSRLGGLTCQPSKIRASLPLQHKP